MDVTEKNDEEFVSRKRKSFQQTKSNLTSSTKNWSEIMKILMNNSNAIDFCEPVDPEALNIPDYFDIIKNPMDFGTIAANIENHKYKTAEEWIRDVKLVFSNCFEYNPATCEVAKKCKKIQTLFEKKLKQHNIEINSVPQKKIKKETEEEEEEAQVEDESESTVQVGQENETENDESDNSHKNKKTNPPGKNRGSNKMKQISSDESSGNVSSSSRGRKPQSKKNKKTQKSTAKHNSRSIGLHSETSKKNRKYIDESDEDKDDEDSFKSVNKDVQLLRKKVKLTYDLKDYLKMNEKTKCPVVSEEEKLGYVHSLRLKVTPKEIILEDGSLNPDYFKPKACGVIKGKWSEKDRTALVDGLMKFGFGEWKSLRAEFLPDWPEQTLRVKASFMVGRQHLELYKGWKPASYEEIQQEIVFNRSVADKFGTWKGYLVNDSEGKVLEYLKNHPSPAFEKKKK